MSSSKTIVLCSSDGETFEVEETAAVESQTIKHLIEDGCADTSIPLPNVTSKILSMVIEYCKKHVEPPNSDEKVAEDELKSFDSDFVKVDQNTLFDLILVRVSQSFNVIMLCYCYCMRINVGLCLNFVCLGLI